MIGSQTFAEVSIGTLECISSFPSCTWERLLIFAKFHFALARSRRRKEVE
jgi:hypothetical protein